MVNFIRNGIVFTIGFIAISQTMLIFNIFSVQLLLQNIFSPIIKFLSYFFNENFIILLIPITIYSMYTLTIHLIKKGYTLFMLRNINKDS
jgi:hypothetical protein